MDPENNNAEEVQDTAEPDFGVGIDLRVGAVSHAVSDGTDAAVIPGNGRERLPTALQLTETGMSLTESAGGTSPTVDAFPHYRSTGGGEGTREQLRFQHDLRALFETAQSDLNADGTEGTFDLPSEIADVFDNGQNPVVTVPGAYDDSDREDIAEVLRATGVNSAAVVRSPLTVAAAHYHSIAEPTLLAVVDIGNYWANIALIHVDPDQEKYDILSRVSTPNLGRNAMNNALAQWLITQTAEELNREIEYTPTAFERVSQAADRVLEDFGSKNQVSVDVSGLEEIELEVGKPPIDINRSVDIGQCDEALNDIILEIIDECSEVISHTSVEREDIDGVVLAGSGSVPDPIANAVGNYFGQTVQRPRLGSERTASVLGAAVLATQWDEDSPPVRTETLSHKIGVLVPTSDGRTYQSVIPETVSEGEEQKLVLTTTRDNQRQGVVTFGSVHPNTGDWQSQPNTYAVAGLPPRPAGDIEVILTVTPRENKVEEVSATIRADGDENLELNSPLDVLQRETDSDSDQWLIPVESDLDFDITDDSPDVPDTELVLPEGHSLSNLDPQQAIEKILNVRYNLWSVYDEGESLSPSSLESLLRQFDDGLRRINVEPIQPKEGDQKDRYTHRTVGTKTSEEYPETSIIEVRRPGYEVDGIVEEPADVIVSEGPPEPQEDSEVNTKNADEANSNDEEIKQSNASTPSSEDPQQNQDEHQTDDSEPSRKGGQRDN